MGSDLGMLRAKLRKSLSQIGKSNGHMCPPTQSNTDPVLHELYVSNEMMAYAKDRYERARDEALQVAFDRGVLDDAVTRVIKNNAGESILGAQGDVYALTVDIAKPASRVDMTALSNHLTTKCGLTRAQIDKALKAATKSSAPAKRAKVVAR